MHRSEITVDLGALRRNVRTLLRTLDGSALCVATIPEGLALRNEYRLERILVLGPAGSNREVAQARDAGLELVIADQEIPEGVRIHLKLDTGMGRYGFAELPSPPAEVVGLMTHLATADTDAVFARAQL